MQRKPKTKRTGPAYWAASVLVLVALQGCSRPDPLPQARSVEPSQAARGQPTQPVALDRVLFGMPRDSTVIEFKYAPAGMDGCFPRQAVIWGQQRSYNPPELQDTFFEAMNSAAVDVVGDPKRLFDAERERARALFRVAGQVTELKLVVCDDYNRFTSMRTNRYGGQSLIKLRWQVFSNLEQRVVYEIRTEGNAAQAPPSAAGLDMLVINAFAHAARNLANDAGFREAVSRLQRVEPSVPRPSRIELVRVAAHRGPIGDNIDAVRLATATIQTGSGHGSGFFVSRGGLLLTNFHVVGEARDVTVRLVNGRRLLARVLRVDRARDVALVQVEERNMTPLPVRETAAQIGETVFSIGTPLQGSLQSTVTRGIVSGFRGDSARGVNLIQSDVAVHPGSSGGPLMDQSGNVVALTVSGLGAVSAGRGTIGGTGIAFFVPIDEALRALGIELVGTAGFEREPTRR
ncbi:MAG: trypsin-like peptidase domain-containing protein [Alphaproteobacteria bacterium]|nr:trypsin-like peptidase domain-containing protein [Alphaproteobacteria bacterium]